ncbi:MAG: hypothetical protein ACHQIK_18220 [Candidatus Acidiferrales bacterium]
MPIEFARISSDKRLTLVIHSGSPDQRTYWALSEFENLTAARKNLQAREGAKHLHDIHSVTPEGQTEGTVQQDISDQIQEWLKDRQDVNAAIWTGLTSNWLDKRERPFTLEDAVAYLRELETDRDQSKADYDRAREYIRNAPHQIQTPIRKIIREKRDWGDSKLPAVLFE